MVMKVGMMTPWKGVVLRRVTKAASELLETLHVLIWGWLNGLQCVWFYRDTFYSSIKTCRVYYECGHSLCRKDSAKLTGKHLRWEQKG